MSIWTIIREWWYRRQRRYDIEILWPEICARSRNIMEARGAFVCHAIHEPAWQTLGEEEFMHTVQNMEAPSALIIRRHGKTNQDRK